MSDQTEYGLYLSGIWRAALKAESQCNQHHREQIEIAGKSEQKPFTKERIKSTMGLFESYLELCVKFVGALRRCPASWEYKGLPSENDVRSKMKNQFDNCQEIFDCRLMTVDLYVKEPERTNAKEDFKRIMEGCIAQIESG